MARLRQTVDASLQAMAAQCREGSNVPGQITFPTFLTSGVHGKVASHVYFFFRE